jgi:ferric-dicitrate binding protein FerR (iron transport regulator)
MPPDTPEPHVTDIALLLRFLAGDATRAEQAVVHGWLRVDPAGERAGLLESLRRGGRPQDPALPAATVAGAWSRMRQDMGVGLDRGPVSTRPDSATRTWWRAVRVAGVVCAAALSITVFRASHRGRTEWREYTTVAGQRESVTLPDGTEFTLAPASRLSVAADYAAGNRAVRLDGEALFAVVHDDRHPFSVRAGTAVITDIGTQFDVRAFGEDASTRIAVVEGMVAVARGADRDRGATRMPPVLRAGDVAIVDTTIGVTHGADVTAMVAWAHGELVFVDAPVPEALRSLSRWYGVTFVAADSAVAKQHLAARFPPESVQELADQLAVALGARYERSGTTIVLRSMHPTHE